MAHVELSLATEVRQSNLWLLSIQCLRIGQKQHVPNSNEHSLLLRELLYSSFPQENFRVSNIVHYLSDPHTCALALNHSKDHGRLQMHMSKH